MLIGGEAATRLLPHGGMRQSLLCRVPLDFRWREFGRRGRVVGG
jgi:hypothetical protein